VTLAVVAAATALVLLAAVRAVSDQRALAAVKRQIQADLFEIRLFNDDLAAMFQSIRGFLQHNATYLRLSLAPSLWMVIPVVLAVPQLDAYFGYRGALIGQPILVTAQMAAHVDPEAMLELPSGVRAETPAVRFPVLRQVVWRVTADANGEYRLRLRVGVESFDKMLHVSDQLARRSPRRASAGFFNELVHPSEPPLPPGAPVESIGIQYPARDFELFGWHVSWLVLFTSEVLLFTFLLKRLVGVNI
jgi:hypothetical protein